MKKNVILVCLALVITISLILVGCSSTPSSTPPPSTTAAAPPASTSTASPTTSAAAPPTASVPVQPTTSAPANVITIKYSDQNSADGWGPAHATIPYLAQITKATNGRVQFQNYFNQSLAKGPDTWAAVQNDIADMGWMVHGYWANLTPLADVMALPFLAFKNGNQASGIAWQLYQKYPTLAAQFKDNHVLVLYGSRPYFLVTTKKQVKTLADWQGLKIRALAGPPVDMLKALGAVPVSMGMPDVYLNLQKGVIDGILVPWEALMSFKFYEVVKYYTYVPTTVTYISLAMNNNVWNKLPPDVQQQINSVSGLQGSLFFGKNFFDSADAAGPQFAKDQGYPVVEYTPPQADIDAWTALAGKPLWDAWVQKNTAAGRPEAKDILNTTLDLIKTYNP